MADWSDLNGLTVPAAEERAAKYNHIIRVAQHGDMWAAPAPARVENRISVAVSTDAEPIVTRVLGRG